jgi:hypothetical protein
MREARAEKMSHLTNDEAANSAEQGAHAAPAKAPSKKGASQKKGAPTAKKSAKPAKAAKGPRAAAKKGASEARANKKAEVIVTMKRAKGVTLTEIMSTTGWQKHTVRGFVSILGSKGGEKIESSKNAGEQLSVFRRYPGMVPRLDGWLAMPALWSSFSLMPHNFFANHPAMTVPSLR